MLGISAAASAHLLLERPFNLSKFFLDFAGELFFFAFGGQLGLFTTCPAFSVPFASCRDFVLRALFHLVSLYDIASTLM
jgi:hypothetical protein